MKNLKILTFVALGISFLACSSDDDSNNNSGAIEGTYELTAFNTSTATDFNDDGAPSTNQMSETNCYDGRKITFRADNTFTYDIDYLLVDTSNGNSSCIDNYTVNGTWSANNNTLTVVYEDEDGADVTINFARSNNGRTLVQNIAVTTFPNRNSEGVAIETIGSVQLIFDK